MVYRRTHQVVKRLAARRSAILAAARDAATDGGMAAVQIAPVALRAQVAAGTVYRYFPSKTDLVAELVAAGRAREAVLTPDDLKGAVVYCGNSLRGLVRAVPL